MGYIEMNPAATVPGNLFTPTRPERKVLTEPEYERAKRLAAGEEIYYLIVCGWHTGMRLQSACLLRWDEVDMDDGMIHITPRKTMRHGITAHIPIHQELMELLRARHAVRGGDVYVSPEMAECYQGRRIPIVFAMRRIFDGIGRPDASFHTLRHTAITRWMRHPNSDIVTVMDMSGHKDPKTLAKYVRPSEDKKRLIMGLEKNETHLLGEPGSSGKHGASDKRREVDTTLLEGKASLGGVAKGGVGPLHLS
jgi:integrase